MYMLLEWQCEISIEVLSALRQRQDQTKRCTRQGTGSAIPLPEV